MSTLFDLCFDDTGMNHWFVGLLKGSGSEKKKCKVSPTISNTSLHSEVTCLLLGCGSAQSLFGDLITENRLDSLTLSGQ